ncbi:MAG: hypothetical protein ACP5PS_10970, partial [Bacteroidales bacterium]
MGCINCALRESSVCDNINTTNWLEEIAKPEISDIVEISFKNKRKEFYKNVNKLKLKTGDIVVVESVVG